MKSKKPQDPVGLKVFSGEPIARDPATIPANDKTAKAKASVDMLFRPLADLSDMTRRAPVPNLVQWIDEIEQEIVERLFAQMGVEGYRVEDADGLLVYQDVRDDTRIARHAQGEYLSFFDSKRRSVYRLRIDRDHYILDNGPVVDNLSMILSDLYRMQFELSKCVTIANNAGLAMQMMTAPSLGMRLMERLMQVRNDKLYLHLSGPANIGKKDAAIDLHREKIRVYELAAESARNNDKLSPSSAGLIAVQEFLEKRHKQDPKAAGIKGPENPRPLESIGIELQRGRLKYGCTPVCVSHSLRPFPEV